MLEATKDLAYRIMFIISTPALLSKIESLKDLRHDFLNLFFFHTFLLAIANPFFLCISYFCSNCGPTFLHMLIADFQWHRRTGHEIFWGGQTLVCPTRGLDECCRGSPGAFSPAKILKCRVSQMPFPAF